MKFTLHTQFPKPKTVCGGVLSVDEKGEAHFYSDDGGRDSKLVAEMHRSTMRFAAAHGIMLSGMQPAGVDKAGRRKYVYQEWWMTYLDVPERRFL